MKMGQETTRFHDRANLLVSSESFNQDPKETEMTVTIPEDAVDSQTHPRDS